MSDTMRDAFEAWVRKEGYATNRELDGETYDDPRVHCGWWAWQAAQSQPAPPVPASVQEIMPLLNAYVRACTSIEASLAAGAHLAQLRHDRAQCEAKFKPLEAALTALVDDNHRLKFELDGVRAMRGPEWQPIETAPEDGTGIIIAEIREGQVFDVLNGHFEVLAEDEEDGPWDIRDGEPWCSYVGRAAGIYFCYWLPGKEYDQSMRYGPNQPYTHWIPRPPPPTHGIEPEQGEVKS